MEQCDAQRMDDSDKRTKRNIDPNDNSGFIMAKIESTQDYVREKRRAEAELRMLHDEYSICKRSTKNANKCNDIYAKFVALAKDVNAKLSGFADDFKNLDDESINYSSSEEIHNKHDDRTVTESTTETTLDSTTMLYSTTTIKKTTSDAENVGPPVRSHSPSTDDRLFDLLVKSKKNKEVHNNHFRSNNNEFGGGQAYYGDGFYYSFQDHSPVDEELFSQQQKARQNSLNSDHSQQQLQQTSSALKNIDNKLNQLSVKSLDTIGASGPFLSLCDQISRNANPQPKMLNTQPTGFSYYNGPQFQTIHQFSGHGPMSVPATGETMKASSQLIFNPGK